MSERTKRRGRATPGARDAAPPAATPPPRALGIALALALTGLAIALWLVRLHLEARAGVHHACTAEGTSIDCDKVATSQYSVILGLPVAVWGTFGYGLAALLATWGLLRRRARGSWPVGLLLATAALAAAASVALAAVSKLLIGAWCLYCMGSWVVAAALLATAWYAARRSGGAIVTLGADWRALRAHPFWGLAAAVAALLAVAVAAGSYDRILQRPSPATPADPRAAGAPLPPGAASRVAAGPLTVVEYSDYECPACARAHDDNRALLAGRSDVNLVRRQFPLDSACNRSMARPLHLDACQLARAAICAGAQGRFAEMDDALFRNQRRHQPVAELAREAGLDLDRFGACLGDPETTRRLSEEIEAGIRAGVQATPSYVINGVIFSGELPAGVLPPRPVTP